MEPTISPQRRIPRYGFHNHIEKLNGRVAMIAFIVLILLERNIGHGILNW